MFELLSGRGQGTSPIRWEPLGQDLWRGGAPVLWDLDTGHSPGLLAPPAPQIILSGLLPSTGEILSPSENKPSRKEHTRRVWNLPSPIPAQARG